MPKNRLDLSLFFDPSKIEPGTELFSPEATLKVSSPLQRFTVEFGMESKWYHCATSTRKDCRMIVHPQDCIHLEIKAIIDR